MGQRCKVCTHEDRLLIDKKIVSGGILTRIAKEYSLAYSTLYRHAHGHVTRQLAQAWDKQSLAENNSLLDRINNIITSAEEIFQRNKGTKDLVALRALDSQRSTIDLLLKISTQLRQAKETELMLQREKEHHQDKETNQMFSEGLECLTTEELKFLKKISQKMAVGDKDKIIIPDEKSQFDDVTYEDIKPDPPNTGGLKRTRHTSQDENTPENASSEAENDQETGFGEDYAIRPVPATKIPVTPWSDNPNNRNRRGIGWRYPGERD